MPEQSFHINLDDTVAITAKGGTFFKFSPGTFQTKGNEVAKGNAVVLIKEYYEPSDIVMAGLHSVSDNGLLQIGGMFKFYVVQNDDTMLAETVKPVLVRMQDKNNLSGTMNVFKIDHNDTAIWNDTRNSFKRILGLWNWPNKNGKLRDFYIDKDLPFERWDVGRKWTEEYIVVLSIFPCPIKIFHGIPGLMQRR